jgi:hypothetical protein
LISVWTDWGITPAVPGLKFVDIIPPSVDITLAILINPLTTFTPR